MSEGNLPCAFYMNCCSTVNLSDHPPGTFRMRDLTLRRICICCRLHIFRGLHCHDMYIYTNLTEYLKYQQAHERFTTRYTRHRKVERNVLTESESESFTVCHPRALCSSCKFVREWGIRYFYAMGNKVDVSYYGNWHWTKG